MNKKLSKILVITLVCLLLVCVSLIVLGCGNIGLSKQPMATIYFYMQGDRVSYQIVSLNQVVKAPEVNVPDGYQIDGWFFDENTWANEFTKTSLTALIDSGATQANVYAKLTPIEYGITYANVKDADVSALPTQFTVESETITLPDISVEYYLFDGWYDGQQKVEQIAKGSFGDKALTARFTPIDYVITYNNTKNATNGNPAKYNIESDKINLAALSKDGYSFDGWYKDDTRVTTIPANSHGNVELTAKWSLVTYTIAYEQAMTADTSEFPASYTIESDSISIPAINVAYYTFEGWYDGQQKVEEIAAGSFGNKTLTAKLTPINYTITYNGTKGATNGNPAKYNIESGAITLAPITVDGYKFDGWYKDGERVTSIPARSHGTLVLEAKWSLVTYSITYEKTLTADTSEFPASYTIESNTISIPVISVAYYVFEGWYDGSQKVDRIVAGSFGNKKLTARLTPIDYTITYNDPKNALNPNPAKYNIESDKINLAALSKDGYSFSGWYIDDERVTSIPAQSHGNIELTAKWSLVNYTISYEQTFTVDTSEFPDSYTIESENIELPTEMTVICRTFTGWTLNDEVVTEIPTGTYGNLVLTATYQENHDVAVDARVAPTCEATGLSEGSHCNRCSEVLVAQKTIPALGHDFTPSWKWEGYTIATVTLVCENDSSHTAMLEASITQTVVKPTCIEEGENTYTAQASYGGNTYTNVKTQIVATVSHAYSATPDENGKHSCTVCEQLLDHLDENLDGKCDVCKQKFEEIIEIKNNYDLLDIVHDLSATYVLRNDVTLEGNWAPLGTTDKPFTGKFYGNGFAIVNLSIAQNSGNGGLFVSNKGLVDGLTLRNLTIYTDSRNSTNSSGGNVTVGGIAAYNYGTIRNCKVEGTSLVKLHNRFENKKVNNTIVGGAICGFNAKDGRIENCEAKDNITVDLYTYARAWATGIATNDCNVTTNLYYGNLAGVNEGTLHNCTTTADTKVTFSVYSTSAYPACESKAAMNCTVGSLVGENRASVYACKAKPYAENGRTTTAVVESYKDHWNTASITVKNANQYEGMVGANTANGKIQKFEKLD